MGEQAILNQVRRWARARNGLRAGLGATAAVLAALVVARLVGGSLPLAVWGAAPTLAAVGWSWPLPWERLLLRAGRRLGVGERLAALDVIVRNRVLALLDPLSSEIAAARPQAWRLAAGPLEIGASALSVGLAVAVALVPVGGSPPSMLPPPSPEAGVVGTVPRSDPVPAERSPEGADVVPRYPTSAVPPAYSPYQDLLAAILGLEGDLLSGEELAARLAAEEGLLRQLAERIAAAAPGGVSPSERAELAAMAQEVARPDLRERVQRLLDRGDEAAAREAAQAVTAVIEAAERAGEEGLPGAAAEARDAAPGPGHGPGSGVVMEDLREGEFPYPDLFDMADPNGQERFARGEERSGIPGEAAGDPLHPGPSGEWDQLAGEEEPIPISGEEGPMRAYLVPRVPGEPASAPAAPPTALAPHEVEVVLRARGIPVELRDLVRRYFELIGGNP